MNRLEEWHHNGVIAVEMSEPALSEATVGTDVSRSRKARDYVCTASMATTTGEQEQLVKIEQCLFPKGVGRQSERNDVEIAFNAWKYDAILVTNDGGSRRQPGGILGNRQALEALGVRVMSDGDAVKYVEDRIGRRDRLAQEQASREGRELPAWVGKD